MKSISIKTMAGCGYVCPVCEGSGIDDKGGNCSWCTPTVMIPKRIKQDPESSVDSSNKAVTPNSQDESLT